MEFAATLCRACGGDLYALDDMLFCAYRFQDRWVMPEFLPLSAADRIAGLSSVVHPYLCADRPLPDGLIWNLTLD